MLPLFRCSVPSLGTRQTEFGTRSLTRDEGRSLDHSSIATAVREATLDIPLVSADTHCQSGNEFLFPVSASAPSGFPEQPISQSDNLVGLVEAVVLIGMLDRVAGDSTFRVKGKYEEPTEAIFLVEVENGFLTT